MEKLFAKNARVAFIGDSLVQGGLLVTHLQEYYRLHLPERRVKIFNLGASGGTAAGACDRFDEVMALAPTEAVVMFGVNDMGVSHYECEEPTEETAAARAACRLRHKEAVCRLVALLEKEGLPVTLCSAVGRDEYSQTASGTRTYGTEEALAGMYRDNLAALSGRLKNSIEYLSSFQPLAKELTEAGLPSLFQDDRTHPNDLGQEVMARIFLKGQGLPVALPTLENFKDGWREAPLSPALLARRCAELALRNLRWVYPHQRSRTGEVPLAERVAYWRGVLAGEELNEYFRKMYTNYVENAHREEEYLQEYITLTDSLYSE